MASKNNPKRDRQLTNARQIAEATGEPFVDPFALFSRASSDDLDLYTSEMLALSAIHAKAEISRFDGGKPVVSITTLEHVEPDGKPASVLSITNSNMPFLYDSVMGEVTSSFRDIFLAIHPILVLHSDGKTVLHSADDASDRDQRVSHIQIHLAKLTTAESENLTSRIQHVLEQVQLAVRDWPAMLKTLDTATQELVHFGSGKKRADKDEALAFLAWLHANNFTFLGMREYTYSGKGDDAKVERGSGIGLGILSDPDVLVLRFGKDAVTTTPEILAFLEGPDYLIVTKANVKSVIHRRAYMDYIGVKRFDEQGNVIGELRIVGLFTSTAYTQAASQIPLLRLKLEKIRDHFGYDPASHSGKMLLNTLESYPRDDLFQIETNLLATFCEQINDLGDRPKIRVLPRIDHFDRFVSVIVYVPREQYDSELRTRIGDYLKTIYEGRVSAYYPAFPEGGVARVHFIIGRSGGKTPRIAQSTLEADIKRLATRWDERFAALVGDGLDSISVGSDYQSVFEPAEAYADLPSVLACGHGEQIRISFHAVSGGASNTVGLKIFYPQHHLSLSRRVPLLENLGFNVISERTFDIGLVESGSATATIVLHDMELSLESGEAFDLKSAKARVEEAFLAAFAGTIDNDSFNRLVLTAELSARQVMIIRAYARYLRQVGIPYSQDYIADTLNKYPSVTRDLYRAFDNRFDIAIGVKQRQKQEALLQKSIETDLAAVPSLDEDRILRRYLNVIMATIRTNAWQTDASGQPKPTLAFKLDPHLVEGMPEPKPFREIFVYGAEVEGLHLRFGKVARGGLRWSDRAQDYRTEVLGLVKAQQVKNAVIVPVGAKGGFFPKQLPANGSRDEIFNAGRDAYKTFIRTLLSVTDNLSGPKVIPPENTVRHDGDDPYFVVAADKGTATFSDTANGIAQEAGFWLDDAFASGGSVGYDHKKMGITARGAWEAVKRHFREMDIDIQATPFTVAGVGDMSGDVFGNGMLLSPKIRLLAAFDHRDIFIDPNPDMAASLAERHRLFNLPRSSWQDYDKSRLSDGAMIISRKEKSVTLTAEAAAAIGIEHLTVTPFEIMTAILKAPVDLLWFGGIGTYIKAPDETDAEVGDRANDAIRISGQDVRAKVIGEGANLGVTARGRVSYGLTGGRCNSDAIDNSAGVNSSDIEVNIKIALANAMRENRLTRPDRDVLLASMTDEVAELVLRNNYLQSLSISLTQRQGLQNGRPLGRLMTALESNGSLNRKVEFLPSELAMTDRYAMGKPLTRAEIGILLSYAKISLFDELILSDLPDDPWLQTALTQYFPEKMQANYAEDIRTHRLHREIIATILANHVINRGGPAFVSSMKEKTGASAADITKAAVFVRDGFGLDRIWAEIDALDAKISGELQNSLYASVTAFYGSAIESALATHAADGKLESSITSLRKAVSDLQPVVKSLVPTSTSETVARQEEELLQAGLSAQLTDDLSSLAILSAVPEIIEIGKLGHVSLQAAATGFMIINEELGIGRLVDAGHALRPNDQFEEQALGRSINDIVQARRAIVASYARTTSARGTTAAARQEALAKVDAARRELHPLADAPDMSLAKLVVASSILYQLARDTTK